MSDWKKKAHTPEKDAVDVYGTYPDNAERRIAHVDCLRSQVIPRDELIEELVKQLQFERDEWHKLHNGNCETRSTDELLAKAHSHGYGKPTGS